MAVKITLDSDNLKQLQERLPELLKAMSKDSNDRDYSLETRDKLSDYYEEFVKIGLPALLASHEALSAKVAGLKAANPCHGAECREEMVWRALMAGLQEDKARLDWAQEALPSFSRGYHTKLYRVTEHEHRIWGEGKTLRAAIDAAITQNKKE